MENEDTIRLLRECSAGVKMGVSTIDEMLPYIKNPKFKDVLYSCKTTHEKLYFEINEYLHKYDVDKKDPPIIASSMAKMKAKIEVAMHNSDKTIASIITDGCNMGVKSLTKYLNEYETANENIKSLVKRLINSEEKLIESIKDYLWLI